MTRDDTIYLHGKLATLMNMASAYQSQTIAGIVRDIEARFPMPPGDEKRGGQRTNSAAGKVVECEACEGDGCVFSSPGGLETCVSCNGSGKIRRASDYGTLPGDKP